MLSSAARLYFGMATSVANTITNYATENKSDIADLIISGKSLAAEVKYLHESYTQHCEQIFSDTAKVIGREVIRKEDSADIGVEQDICWG